MNGRRVRATRRIAKYDYSFDIPEVQDYKNKFSLKHHTRNLKWLYMHNHVAYYREQARYLYFVKKQCSKT